MDPDFADLKKQSSKNLSNTVHFVSRPQKRNGLTENLRDNN